jgi:hypothetical protein
MIELCLAKYRLTHAKAQRLLELYEADFSRDLVLINNYYVGMGNCAIRHNSVL